MIYIGTTRYNTTTLAERNKWIKKKKWDGCAYGFDKKLPETIPSYQWCYIIEMINDINKIAGIGYIKNEYCPLARSRMYSEEHYNMYVYKGKKYISRENLYKNFPKTIEYLEQILFKGSTHMKRGIGVTLLNFNKFSICDVKKPPRRCGNCLEYGHNKQGCKKKRRKTSFILQRSQRICPLCNKLKYKWGHTTNCSGIKKDVEFTNLMIDFFKSLFKSVC
jgi:hypothetical protein